MKKRVVVLILIIFISCDFNENGTKEETFVPSNYFSSVKFKTWATGYINYIQGENLAQTWSDPKKALGKASDSVYDVVSLGEGGEITLTFDKTIYNGMGTDFAVFENSFDGSFLELAFVGVSSNGIDFVSFDTETLWDTTVDSYGKMDPKKLKGFAGLTKVGYGTVFDLEDLKNKSEVISGKVDLNSIRYIKIVDIIGDGREIDSKGKPIYDPYPTYESAGFDLDAIGVYNCK